MFAPLYAARFKHDPPMFVVGDQLQLPPHMPVDSESFVLVKQYGVAFMTRMVKCGHPCQMLRKQYRMHPEIMAPMNRLMHHGQLEADSSTASSLSACAFKQYIHSNMAGGRGSYKNMIVIDTISLDASEQTIHGWNTVLRAWFFKLQHQHAPNRISYQAP